MKSAIRISWCANKCGYVEAGVIPKFSVCDNGIAWFKERGRWLEGGEEPLPGMIVFFDRDDPDGWAGPQDGVSDRTGIVERVEGGYVYTVEGNSGDACVMERYLVGDSRIMGYGAPAY